MADQGSEGLLSPYLREKRIQAIIPFLDGYVLDYGCGTGKLAEFVVPQDYLGFEVDEESLRIAKECYPHHAFTNSLPNNTSYDTAVALAVIEHMDDPILFLKVLSDSSQGGKIIITTPHPLVEWIHSIGAKIGLFSMHANEEHCKLFNRRDLEEIGAKVGLKMVAYSRFLFGGNQLAIFSKEEL